MKTELIIAALIGVAVAVLLVQQKYQGIWDRIPGAMPGDSRES